METALIVSGFTSDEELIAASLLHDVVEDAGVSEEELRRRFGSRVSGLVMQASEDKSKSWQERKSTALSRLKEGSWDLKVLAMGDKLSNMRCTARDYMIIGDAPVSYTHLQKLYAGGVEADRGQNARNL